MSKYLDKNAVQYLWNKMKGYIDSKIAAGGGFTYSMTEQWTGDYWIDGKKIYCKTVNFGQLPNNSIKTIEHGISNIDYVIKCDAIAKNSSNTVHFTLPYVNFYTSSASITFYFDNKYVSAHTGGNHNSLDKCYITFFYTKTTN